MGRARFALLAVLGLVQPPCEPPFAPYSASSISGQVQVDVPLRDPTGLPIGDRILSNVDGIVVYLDGASRRDSTRTKRGVYRFNQVAIGDWRVTPAVGGAQTDIRFVGVETKNDQIEVLGPLQLRGVGDLVAIPNPFSFQTAIQFRLTADTRVRLQVVDLAGNLKRVLADRTFVAGAHIFVWDGANDAGKPLPNGNYAIVFLAGTDRTAGSEPLDRRAEIVAKEP